MRGDSDGVTRSTSATNARSNGDDETTHAAGHSSARDDADPDAAQVLDARLLPAALCCWGATIVALTAGWRTGVMLAAALAVSAIGLWVLLLWAIAHRGERWRVVAVVALAAVVLGAGFAAAAAWRAHRVATHPLRAASGQSLRVVVTPTDDPKMMRGKTFGGEKQWVVRADLREYRRGAATVRAGGTVVVLATGEGWAELSPGRPVEFLARVDQPRRADLTVVALSAQGPPKIVGPLPWWQGVAGSVRADFAAAAARVLPADAAGLLPALVVGDTSALPAQVRDEFDIAGMQHLCVVSGANFTILLSVVLFAVRLLTLGPRTAAVVAAVALVMFVVVARPDPSVLRAGAMGAITVLALITGRRKQALPALCAATIALLALWPGLAVNAGFALSVVATAGLILVAPSWADWLRARGWWRAPAEIVAVSAGAFVVTAPIMVALTGRLSLVAILANVLVAPVVAPITVIGAGGAVLSCLWSPLAGLVLRCAAPPMWWLLFVAEHAAAVPGASVAVPGGLAGGLIAGIVVAAAIVALRSRAVRRIAAAMALGVAAILIPVRVWHPGWPPNGWILAACDVGQGDGLALAVGPGAAVVIDVGPDPGPIRTCLDRLNIAQIPLLILTHPHADHIGGLTGALQDRAVAAIAVGLHELDGLPLAIAPEHAHPPPGADSGCESGDGATSSGERRHADSWPSRARDSRVAPTGARFRTSDGRDSAVEGHTGARFRAGGRRDRAAGGAASVRFRSNGGRDSAIEGSAGVPVGTDVRTTSVAEWRLPGGDRIGGGASTWAHTACRPAGYGPVPTVNRTGSTDPLVPVVGLGQVATVARNAGVPLLELSAGHVLSFGAVELEVLAPTLHGPRPTRGAEADDANDRSVVVVASTPAGRILLTGDIEAPAQRALMHAGIPIQADILKLPHHGSRTTTRDFLDAVCPRLVLVSVGTNNTFGHPNPAVLADLSALGATVARTDQHGDIAIVGDGRILHITTSR
ncbi:ComEC/Rec2 family competence protein [Nocardia sp. NBC_01730]|uniref:ComEC/Rec2 family competence protein n=1 Tax=Nocardia sp. NBC_01730 TaxID=2975998 RepID=UPI002E10E8C9|nr:ComEC/Rec2 family competence protein [Nocardia sp. NBC_01730]